MISTILWTLMAVYIVIAVFIFGLFALGTINMGGFENYAQDVNAFPDDEHLPDITSTQLQWAVVLLSMFWPVIIWVMWGRKKS
jgi:hypothetical protein